MRIGIHALWMDTDPLGGLASYLATLISNLGIIDSRNDYSVYFGHARALRRSPFLPSRFRPVVLQPRSSWIQIPVSLPLELLRAPVDLLHTLAVAPPWCPVPFVQTINDLDWELNPQFYPRAIRVRLSLLVPRSARRARRILTISEFSKKCLIERYAIPEEKIVVAYHGVDASFRVIEDPGPVERVRRKFQTGDTYILYVGKLQRRKNITRLLRAYHRLRREHGIPHRLVLVGRRTFTSEEIFATLKDLELGDDVVVTGEVDLEDLVRLYNGASLFVFPSLSEGFGIPPLEAMACGVPVVASSATSVPEIVGDAAVTFDPYDVAAMAGAMHGVLTDEGLRRDLVARGFKRVATFSNRSLAETSLRVYEEAAG
jgi:glycosyltransferase involved in cell wall biosynthesis